MRSPQSVSQSPHPLIPTVPPTPQFHSTVALQKQRRFNLLALVFRAVTFCFSLASAIFMLSNTRHDNSSSPSSSSSSSSRWFDFSSFRYVFAANAIVALYSLLEMVGSVWEISRGLTLFPEVVQVWFDFAHDQVFAYMLISAGSAGTELAKSLKGSDTCTATSAFCLQSDISIGLGFVGFLFLGFSALLSGYRVVCYIINGSRFHI